MAVAILFFVAILSCLAFFLFDGLNQMTAFALLLISGLWILQSNEIPRGWAGIKLIIGNLLSLMLCLLLLRLYVSVFR